MIPATGAAGCYAQNAFIAVFDWAFLDGKTMCRSGLWRACGQGSGQFLVNKEA